MSQIFSAANAGPITDLVSGISWSAHQLQTEAGRRVAFLKAQKIGKGDIVLVSHGGSPGFFADLLALWQTGAAAACLNPALTANEIETVSNFVKPAAILLGPGEGEREIAYKCPQFDLAEIAGDEEPQKPQEPLALSDPPAKDDPALILFTSGTTGDPKGVVHTFTSLKERLTHNWKFLAAETLARTLCILPTHFGHGLIGNCLTPLLAGHHLFLYQNPGLRGMADLGRVIDSNRITFFSSVPSFWKMVLKTAGKPAGQTLKRVSVGSAPLSAEAWQGIIDWTGIQNVWNMYGITETANWAAGAAASDLGCETGLIGAMWGGEAAILTKGGERLSEGEGEILLKTPSLMAGYFQRPDLTAEVLKDGWYHTGDRGSIDDQGIIRLLGRIKTEINKAGMKILPEEVDALLEGHEDVLEACAFGIADAISGETVAAAYTLKKESRLSPADLRAWCKLRIRPDCIPEKWYIVPEIPKTDRGKVNRMVVRDYCLKGDGNG